MSAEYFYDDINISGPDSRQWDTCIYVYIGQPRHQTVSPVVADNFDIDEHCFHNILTICGDGPCTVKNQDFGMLVWKDNNYWERGLASNNPQSRRDILRILCNNFLRWYQNCKTPANKQQCLQSAAMSAAILGPGPGHHRDAIPYPATTHQLMTEPHWTAFCSAHFFPRTKYTTKTAQRGINRSL